jgi:hypothetical protein
MQRHIGHLILMLVVMVAAAGGATISFTLTAPTPGANDIAALMGAALDRDNVGGDGTTDGTANDSATYVASDRPAQGQTFTTGPAMMMVGGIWIQHPGYSGNNPPGEASNNTWYAMAAGSQITLRITDPAASGTAGFILGSETAAITGTEPGVLPAATANSPDGTATWIHIKLDSPVALAANTTYGFDLGASAGTFFEILGIRDAAAGGNPYAAGSAYTSGAGGVGANTLTAQAGDRVFIVEMVPLATAASNPNPADGGGNVDTDALVTLSWDAGLTADPDTLGGTIPNPDILYHYVYLRVNEPNFLDVTPIIVGADTDPADGVVDSSAATTLDSLLTSDAVYYWRVDEILDDGTGAPRSAGDPNNITGPVWSFETEKKNPQLNPALPANVAADRDETVTFAVEAVNPLTGDDTGMTYQWYRNDVLLPDATQPRYTRIVQSGDENSTYYCRVTLTETARTVTSRTAVLRIKEMLAHWTFDGSVSDVTGNGNDGTHIGDPNYAAGKVGDALVFDGAADYVDLPDGFSDFRNGLTVTLWAMPAAAGSYARFFDWGNGASNDNIFFCRLGTSNTLAFNVYLADVSSTPVEAANALELDAWQFLVVTMDNGGNVVLYKNGVPLQTGTVFVPAVVTRTNNFIGESNWAADALYAGLMDDIKLYNYPMSGTEVADLYYASEGEFCLEYPAWDLSGPEGRPDCVVDLYDLEGLAEEFLDCGYFPECP